LLFQLRRYRGLWVATTAAEKRGNEIRNVLKYFS
jgi:hypothetical protein